MKLQLVFVSLLAVHYSSATLVDLSYGYVDSQVPIIKNPSLVTFRYTKRVRLNLNGIPVKLNTFETSEHVGTHLDAPCHVGNNPRTVDQIPLERFFAKGVLINATEETGDNYNYTLPKEKLLEWECTNGPFPNHSVVLVDFGWGRFYPDTDTYIGPGGRSRAPGLSKEAAEYIVETKKVIGVGVETVSLDHGDELVAHKAILENDLFGLENLNFSTPLPPIFDLIVMPMKLVEGTGAPARVVALV